jgi:pimeloyl-ACP methyl ester carboxylesterase
LLSTNVLTRPHLGMFALEPVRAALEFARLQFTSGDSAARGDGHAVVLFPGLGTDHRVMMPLSKHCERLGYAVRDWGRGCNTGPAPDARSWLRELTGEVAAATPATRKAVTLIGWSLGGLYAREIAKAIPGRVRQVITLGTPVARLADATNVQWLFEFLSGVRGAVDASLARALRTPPPVPTTSIYSRSDGVVAWQACIGKPGPQSENIEVESSHLGLVWHPDVLRVVGDRLAQPPGNWRPHVETTAHAA